MRVFLRCKYLVVSILGLAKKALVLKFYFVFSECCFFLWFGNFLHKPEVFYF